MAITEKDKTKWGTTGLWVGYLTLTTYMFNAMLAMGGHAIVNF